MTDKIVQGTNAKKEKPAGFSFLQFILSSDAQGSVLFHILGVSIEDGLQDVGDELLHLLGCTAHKVLRHKPMPFS